MRSVSERLRFTSKSERQFIIRSSAGEYKPGEKLLSENSLAVQYGVSRMTVNKAIMELVNKEYLTRIQGSGTYVSKIRKEGGGAQRIRKWSINKHNLRKVNITRREIGHRIRAMSEK